MVAATRMTAALERPFTAPCTPPTGPQLEASGFTAGSRRPSHPPLTSTDALRGATAGHHRPLCVRWPRVAPGSRALEIHGRAWTARVGAVMPTVHPAFGSDLAFQDACSISSSPSSPGSDSVWASGRLGIEGVGDPLVRGVSLPVDAMSVDLQQDRDAVPGGLGEWNHRPAIASSVPPVNDHPLDLTGALEEGEDLRG
jgi:hypothetical protein